MDRFIKGLIAGLAGGITMNVWNLFAFYVINLSMHRLLDWSAVYAMGREANNALEIIFTLISQLIWSGFLGIIFIYLILLISSKFLIIKALMFSYVSGFLMWATPVLFKTPILMDMEFGTIFSHAIESIIFGLTLAFTIKWLEAKYVEN